MTATTHQDHWLLPTRQCEYSGLDPLADTVLHGRREATMLALAALAFTATLIVPVAAGWIDVAAALRIQVPFASIVPVGVLVMPIAIAVALVVSELFGRRRSIAFGLALAASAIATAAVIGLTTQVLALAGYTVVVHLAGVLVFDVFRMSRGRLFWLRALIATLFAQLVGWAAFGGVLLLYGTDQQATIDVATAGLIYSAAGAFVLVVPVAIAKAVLGRYLRLGGAMPARVRRVAVESSERTRIPHHVPSGRFARASVYPTPVSSPIVRPASVPAMPARRDRDADATVQAYSSAEMKFFQDGDEL